MLVFGHEVALVNLPDILKQSGLVFLIGDETAASANEDLANVAALVRAAGAVMLTLVCANGKDPEGRCPETGNPQFNLGSAAVVELSRASGTGDGGPFAQQALDIITGLCGMRNNNDSIAGVDLEDIRFSSSKSNSARAERATTSWLSRVTVTTSSFLNDYDCPSRA